MTSQKSTAQMHYYDIFLSFRGQDTRNTFTDRLYTALIDEGFNTFRDNNGIERGENIKSELDRAINFSRTSVIVLSENYATSGWCLDELVMIINNVKTKAHTVLPVFYYVDPAHVKNQMGSYAKAFAKHDVRLGKQTDGRSLHEMMVKVKGWRAALKEVAEIGGMVLQCQPGQDDEYETKFVKKVVKVIADKLSRNALKAPFLIDIQYRAKDVNLWLQDELSDAGICMICGIGGIGKTTIAQYVYNLNFKRFESSSFLANVRELSEGHNGLIRLQRQLLADILGNKPGKFSSIEDGIVKIKDAAFRKRVLLVLDDVDHVDQLNAVLGTRDWFWPGSKIIITTRQDWLLKPHEVDSIYKVDNFTYLEALELFSWHAFGRKHPYEGYLELSKRVVCLCEGLPLALQVLGSSLLGKKPDVWESAIKKLKVIPDNKIIEKLKLSYESLQDEHDKKLFLHVACLFVGMDRDYCVSILDSCDFYTVIGIQNLIDRSLLFVDECNKLAMHHLLRDMGRAIVRQESQRCPGKRSILWNSKDSFRVLSEKTGSEKIQAIVLDMNMVEDNLSITASAPRNTVKYSLKELLNNFSGQSVLKRRHYIGDCPVETSQINLETGAIADMHKLRLLRFSSVQLTGCYEELPKGLKWLYWRKFSLECIPSNFFFARLVALDMRYSSLKQVWKGIKNLESLKILNLSHSCQLIKTPDFSGLPNLERLILKDCPSLIELHQSIGGLGGLNLVNLKGCRSLKSLPESISRLRNLETLNISSCSGLEWLPLELRTMDSLKVFEADGISINKLFFPTKQVHSRYTSFWPWIPKQRTNLDVSLASLPNMLVRLSLKDCGLSDDAFIFDFSNLSMLKSLNLSKNPISYLPDSIKCLARLQSLSVKSCTKLKSLRELPNIKELYIKQCTSLVNITYGSTQSKYPVIDHNFDCSSLVMIQGVFKLEPIENVSVQLLENFGVDVESLGNTKMKLDLYTSDVIKKLPVQGLYERGIFTIFLPGDKVPSWFMKDSACSVSFTIAPSACVRWLSVAVLYMHSDDEKSEFDRDFWEANRMIIWNRTKKLKWTHQPTVFGIPEGTEDMTWLSCYRFGSLLEGGDEVAVSVELKYHYKVKEFGIELVCYDPEEQNQACEVPNPNDLFFEDVIPRDHLKLPAWT